VTREHGACQRKRHDVKQSPAIEGTETMQSYIDRAARLARQNYVLDSAAYSADWNKLEDELLALPRAMQHALVDLAISVTPMTGAAMVITCILQFEELTCDDAA